MQGEIRLIQEGDLRKIVNQPLESIGISDNAQVCLRQDGNIVKERGQEICTSTTLSFVTSLRQEKK